MSEYAIPECSFRVFIYRFLFVFVLRLTGFSAVVLRVVRALLIGLFVSFPVLTLFPTPVPPVSLSPVPAFPVIFGIILLPSAGDGDTFGVIVTPGAVLFGGAVVSHATNRIDSNNTMRTHANIRFIFFPPDEYCCVYII
jgi:hypothetical protein